MRVLTTSLTLIFALSIVIEARAQEALEITIPIELRELHSEVTSAIVTCELSFWNRPGRLSEERTIPMRGSYSGSVTVRFTARHPTGYLCRLELQHRDGTRSAPLGALSRTSTSLSTTSLPTTTTDELAWARAKTGTALTARGSGELPLECLD